MSGEFDLREDSHSTKLERRPRIFVKLSKKLKKRTTHSCEKCRIDGRSSGLTEDRQTDNGCFIGSSTGRGSYEFKKSLVLEFYI